MCIELYGLFDPECCYLCQYLLKYILPLSVLFVFNPPFLVTHSAINLKLLWTEVITAFNIYTSFNIVLLSDEMLQCLPRPTSLKFINKTLLRFLFHWGFCLVACFLLVWFFWLFVCSPPPPPSKTHSPFASISIKQQQKRGSMGVRLR